MASNESATRASALDGCVSVEVPEGWEYDYLDYQSREEGSLRDMGYPQDAFLRVYNPEGGYYENPFEPSGRSPRVAVYVDAAGAVAEDGGKFLEEQAEFSRGLEGLALTTKWEEKDGRPVLVIEEEREGDPNITGQPKWSYGHMAYIPTTSGVDLVVLVQCSLWSDEEREQYSRDAEEIIASAQLNPPYEGYVDKTWMQNMPSTNPLLPGIIIDAGHR